MWTLDPDAVRGAFEVIERGRAEGQRSLAERLSKQGHLRPKMTIDEAADLLWVITSFDAFDQLYTGRGLSAEKVAQRLITMAENSLFKTA
jgi:hypothetical protein